jgi:hypothetical protein
LLQSNRYPTVAAIEVDIPAEVPKVVPTKRKGRTPVSAREPERLLELQWASSTITALHFCLRLPAKFPAVAASMTASVNALPVATPATLPHTGT